MSLFDGHIFVSDGSFSKVMPPGTSMIARLGWRVCFGCGQNPPTMPVANEGFSAISY